MTNYSKFVKVVSAEEKTNSEGRTYKVLKLVASSHQMVFDPEVNAMVPALNTGAKVGTEVAFEKSYLPSLEGKSDDLYNVKLGDRILGDVVKRETEAYSFPDSNGELIHATSCTMFVKGDTTDKNTYERAIISKFKSNDRIIKGSSSLINSLENAEDIDLEDAPKEETTVTAEA